MTIAGSRRGVASLRSWRDARSACHPDPDALADGLAADARRLPAFFKSAGTGLTAWPINR